MNPDDTIVVVSSPRGGSARGIVRLSGPQAVAVAARLFTPSSGERLASARENRYFQGLLTLGPARIPAAAYLFRGPRSYTRQDVVELHLLGAPGLLGWIVETCLAAGARRAEPGEFTARAFLAGVLDLSQVHGIAGMIAARSDCQLRAAERLLHGGLARAANQAREELADLLSLVEGTLDFADEPIEFISPQALRARLDVVGEALRSTVAAGVRAERWGQAPQVVLAGGPNVGKSSLLNRLTGVDRALCAPIAGTTRDVLSAPLDLGSTECLLIDMAGLADAGMHDYLHYQTQAAARQAIREADLILQVIDASKLSPLSDCGFRDELQIRAEDGPARPGRREDGVLEMTSRIVVANKWDLIDDECRDALSSGLARRGGSPVCLVSARTGEGCEELKRRIESALSGRPVDVHDAAIALMAEHRDALERALEAIGRAVDLAAACGGSLSNAELVAAELHAAANALAALAGREDIEGLLDRVFSRFCIGK